MRKVRRSRVPAGARCVTPATTREFGGRRNWPIVSLSIGPRLGRDRLDVASHGVEVHRAVVEAYAVRIRDPHQRVLEPVEVVALREILAGMRPAALGAIG